MRRLTTRTILYLCLIGLLTPACNVSSQDVKTPVPSEYWLPSLSPTLELSPTVLATFAQTPSTVTTTPTFTPTPTVTPTFDPSTGLRTQCLEIAPALPEGTQLEGKLLLGNDHFLDLATGEQTPLALNTGSITWLEISPNRKWMYYTDCRANKWGSRCVDAIASVEEVVTTFPHRDDVWMWEWWLDNDRLFIIPYGFEPTNKVIVLNPFSGEETELSLDLPDPYYVTPDNVIYFLPINLDPTLTRAVYYDREGIGRLILWDIPARKMLAWLSYPIVLGEPVFPPGSGGSFSGWSPDGNQFATTSPVTFSDPAGVTPAAEELFSISREGQVRQLTHLSAGYEYVRISGLQWSPDGRHIAFWLLTAGEANPSLEDLVARQAVLDTVTQEVTDYCIGTSKFTRLPVWSPDGQQVVVSFLSEDSRQPIILIDLVNGLAALIAEDVNSSLEGWMVSP